MTLAVGAGMAAANSWKRLRAPRAEGVHRQLMFFDMVAVSLFGQEAGPERGRSNLSQGSPPVATGLDWALTRGRNIQQLHIDG